MSRTSLIVFLLLCICGYACSKIVLINERMETDEVVVTKADTTDVADTAREPITFSVSVDGWEELEIINK